MHQPARFFYFGLFSAIAVDLMDSSEMLFENSGILFSKHPAEKSSLGHRNVEKPRFRNVFEKPRFSKVLLVLFTILK